MKHESKATYDNEILARVKIAEFLKEYRLQCWYTQEQLSAFSDLSRSTIIRLESGKPVSFLSIQKYANGLKLPLNHLFLDVE